MNSINVALVAMTVVSCFSMIITYLIVIGIKKLKVQGKYTNKKGTNTEVSIDIDDKKKSR